MSRRVLHVVGGMNRGGVETWLMHVLRHIDRQQFKMDFLVHTTQPCAYDDEIRALGSNIIPCMTPSHPLTYARNFKRILRERGPYDVVHSHVHHYSGLVLWLAYQSGVPIRMAHSHNDTSGLRAQASLPRRLYLLLTEVFLKRYATLGLAASSKAAIDLFGHSWQTDPRWRVFYYGINLEQFQAQVDRTEIRSALGIPVNSFVIGHVGRFVRQKNHTFIVDIAAEVAKCEPLTYFLLVGDGPLRSEIECKVAQAGLSRRFIFAGSRSDVPRLMLGAMDVFLFPSLYEGLGLVAIEAQTAGLPTVLSDVIPDDTELIKPLLWRLSLQQSPSTWAETILSARTKSTTGVRQVYSSFLAHGPFDITYSIGQLEHLYNGETPGYAVTDA